MNILVIGSGGREHALSWKIAQSSLLDKLYIAPGNAGTNSVGENISLNISDHEIVKDFILKKNIEMVVVGPEQPLVDGFKNKINKDPDLQHIKVLGPTTEGAKLEGSKDFAKDFMMKYNIPTAQYKSFTSKTLNDGIAFLESIQPPYVLKADGLAAGKGVLILNSLEDAKSSLKEMLEGKFGSASHKVVIEEFLDGIELSAFVLTDGKDYVILPEAKDYKRIGEGDTGLNTGGMGAVSPVPFADHSLKEKIRTKVIEPTIKGIQKENIHYEGFLFFGLMVVSNEPYVIEYNVRMGDPEAEVVLPRIKNDLVELFNKTCENRLKEANCDIDRQSVTTVMLVSGGYPESYEKGKEIHHIDKVKESIPFHAGTRLDDEKIVTSGGRVIALSSFGKNFKEALSKSYESARIINFEKMYYRRDIGFDLK